MSDINSRAGPSSIRLTPLKPKHKKSVPPPPLPLNIAKFLTEELPDGSITDSALPDIFHHAHDSETTEEEILAEIHPSYKRTLYALLELPASSPSALLLHALMTFLIVLSALVTVLETVPAFHSISVSFWFAFETSLVALFTVEYTLRTLAWSTSWKTLFSWTLSFYGIIDLLAILPYYIEIMLHQDTSVFFRFSILRMFRLLRVFRAFRYNNTILLTIEVMYLSVQRSKDALFAIGFFVIMVLSVFSTLLYFAERGTWDETLETFINADGDPTQFASIPAAAWFVLVTLSTVGYGEITPRSFLGRLVTLPLLVFGLLLLALPSFVLGREFSLVWEMMTRASGNRANKSHDSVDDLEQPTPTRGPLLSAPPRTDFSSSALAATRDLSNRKLAHNQTELSAQITELRESVVRQGELLERQGEMMSVLLKLVESREAERDKGKGREEGL